MYVSSHKTSQVSNLLYYDKFTSKLTERHFGLARLIQFGGLLARSDLVDGINSERILDAFKQVGCFELGPVGVDVAGFEPRRSRHVALFNDVARDGRSTVGLRPVPRHCDVVRPVVLHAQTSRRSWLV